MVALALVVEVFIDRICCELSPEQLLAHPTTTYLAPLAPARSCTHHNTTKKIVSLLFSSTGVDRLGEQRSTRPRSAYSNPNS